MPERSSAQLLVQDRPQGGRPQASTAVARERDGAGRFVRRKPFPQQSSNGNASGSVALSLARILRPQAAYRWQLPQLAAITPLYVETILRGALAGNHFQAWELFDLMEDTWPRLSKNLNELKNGVKGMKMQWSAYQEDPTQDPAPSAVDKLITVRLALQNMKPDPYMDENGLSGTVTDILDAWSKGASVQEILWHVVDTSQGQIMAPRATYWVHPVTYAWSQEGLLGFRESSYLGTTTYQPMPNVIPFPENKFLAAIRKQKSGTPLGAALLRPLAWWWLAANFSADWLLNLAQVHGLPFRWANYDPNASQDTIDSVCQMLQSMGSEGWAAFPAGTTLDLKEASGRAESMPQSDVINRADKNCDLIVLGQTLTTDTGGGSSSMGGGRGSFALGRVHASVRQDVVEACAEFVADIFNLQLVPMILRLNYGDESEPPTVKMEDEKTEDLLQKSEILKNIAPFAATQIPAEWINETFNIPIPDPGVKTLQPPQPTGFEAKPASETTPQDGDVADKLKAIHKIADDAQFELALKAAYDKQK